MSFLELDDKEGLGMYIKHDFRLGKFVINNAEGVEPLDFEYMLIDTDFQTGYGKYDGQYQFVWDQQVGVKPDNAKDLVAQDYKRANKDAYNTIRQNQSLVEQTTNLIDCRDKNACVYPHESV